MCGIVGYLGKRSAVDVIVQGLKSLESRGYDSAGVCVPGPESLLCWKAVGCVSKLEEILPTDSGATLGIGHTRWATNGKPTEINAHPHFDCKGEIAICHNGIIENHDELRRKLEAQGHKFVSATDSEVLAHLIEQLYEGNLEQAVTACLKLVEGTFGLAVIRKGERKLVAAARKCPILVGINEQQNEFFVSSQDTVIAPYAENAIVLGEDEIAVVTDEGVAFKDFNGQILAKEARKIHFDDCDIGLNGYKHFMLKEIFQQPVTVAKTINQLLVDGDITSELTVDFAAVKRIVITGCGTSWHAGLIGEHLFEGNAGIVTEVDYASEFRYRKPLLTEDDLVIVISQSGETADTFAALEYANEKGAQTLAIVNAEGSKIAENVDHVVYLNAGPEIGVASTKAFTSQVTALIILAALARKQKGLPDNGLLQDLMSVPDLIKQALESYKDVQVIARQHWQDKNSLFLGRGIDFPTALEGALKLKEISYIHAEGYPAAEMKHGPIALVDEAMLVVFVAPRNGTYDKILNNMQEIKARGGHILAIVNKVDEQLSALADETILVPKCRDELAPIVHVIALQLLAYSIAQLKGCEIDRPRNLAKAVTVE